MGGGDELRVRAPQGGVPQGEGVRDGQPQRWKKQKPHSGGEGKSHSKGSGKGGKSKGSGKGKHGPLLRNKEGKQICYAFNSSTGCQAKDCARLHICRMPDCGQSHSVVGNL